MSNQSEHYVHLADKVRLIWPDLLFCACLFSMAIAIGMRATVSGPGVTPDSAEYISMATNIYRGHGFVADVTGPFESDDGIQLAGAHGTRHGGRE